MREHSFDFPYYLLFYFPYCLRSLLLPLPSSFEVRSSMLIAKKIYPFYSSTASTL